MKIKYCSSKYFIDQLNSHLSELKSIDYGDLTAKFSELSRNTEEKSLASTYD